jgi:hypothetical protein
VKDWVKPAMVFARSQASSSALDMPSTPAAPLLALTRL